MIFVKSKSILVVTAKITVFWDFMPYGLEEVYQYYSKTCCLHPQGWK
jgi:hypothetical protein